VVVGVVEVVGVKKEGDEEKLEEEDGREGCKKALA
jgi:hypothetical protein